ncbi:sigma-E factor negative regulatory protein RseA [Herbaspirillum sp. Sphag1AN]|uniref:sigma-E factor negative regulatory protein n=1 Tax=unclassified Herbaspirillum TaxID=2624150 RepID=UPI00160A396E|nr:MULTISPECIES: sigma-E factor negative regulatory protein [unclassified Herbaspirillum]MBB3211490.1 sigma-E factor negative regulatory protein RseA [Herbaspirillum sp. Sphag1AN]MBB3245244.1 sigma-E factor negative regulatory protein RseA [Herbaspirillum sp. Sphag64]
MKTIEMSREQISAFADGELTEAHFEFALAALRQPEALGTWELYHQIGDTLRSEEMAFSLSDDFSAKMSARLAAEPLILAPLSAQGIADIAVGPAVVNGAGLPSAIHRQFMRRFAVPGVAVAAAVAAIVFVAAPQHPALTSGDNALASGASSTSASPGNVMSVATTSGTMQRAGQISALSQQGEVARDANIDEYLVAHQRFSPAMYSSAQYARSAGFTINSDK